MKAILYEYNGDYYTIPQLVNMSNNLKADTIRSRIKEGWDIGLAITVPNREVELDPKWRGKSLMIIFSEPIPSVFASMQPCLNKTYIAQPATPTHTYERSKPYYIITLENGKPLIVYPNEFQIIAEAKIGA